MKGINALQSCIEKCDFFFCLTILSRYLVSHDPSLLQNTEKHFYTQKPQLLPVHLLVVDCLK